MLSSAWSQSQTGSCLAISVPGCSCRCTRLVVKLTCSRPAALLPALNLPLRRRVLLLSRTNRAHEQEWRPGDHCEWDTDVPRARRRTRTSIWYRISYQIMCRAGLIYVLSYPNYQQERTCLRLCLPQEPRIALLPSYIHNFASPVFD